MHGGRFERHVVDIGGGGQARLRQKIAQQLLLALRHGPVETEEQLVIDLEDAAAVGQEQVTRAAGA